MDEPADECKSEFIGYYFLYRIFGIRDISGSAGRLSETDNEYKLRL